MLWCVLVFVYYALFPFAIPRSEESLLKSLEELNQNPKSMYLNLSSALQTLERRFEENLKQQEQKCEIAVEKMSEKLDAIFDHVIGSPQNIRSQDSNRTEEPDVFDSSEILKSGQTTSGVYDIYVVHQNQRYYATAFCEMDENDGWTVFQKRVDGSVDFYREWQYYADGFGNPEGEFWLGNNILHLLTSKRRYRLINFEADYVYADYSTFSISSSADKYRLTVGEYSGTAGDSLLYHSGCQFSTKDNDNDEDESSNCAEKFRAAWWYDDCQYSNLNGLYLFGQYNSPDDLPFNGLEGIRWSTWHGPGIH